MPGNSHKKGQGGKLKLVFYALLRHLPRVKGLGNYFMLPLWLKIKSVMMTIIVICEAGRGGTQLSIIIVNYYYVELEEGHPTCGDPEDSLHHP